MSRKDLDSQQGIVRTYYRTLDEGEYDLLEELLAPSFVHERPDRTLEGRDRFLQFMRNERPTTGTSHEVGSLYRQTDGPGVVATGRLLGPDGDLIVRFADAFTFDAEKVRRIETYSR